MKKILLTFLMLGSSYFSLAQTQSTVNYNYDEKPFNNSKKEFNDWSVSVFGGMNLMQNSDFVSWQGGFFEPGYDFQIQLNKQITHAFGLSVQYQLGKTKGGQYIEDMPLSGHVGWANVKTDYHGISVLADVNASNLLRRVDNKTEFKWALHLYGGVGFLGYKAYRDHYKGSGDNYTLITDQPLGDKSFYSQVGSGLRYKINRKFDAELRAMYVMSGDEEFDGSGKPMPYKNSGGFTAADTEEGRDDNMITLSLGLHYKIGRHDESLQWYSPLNAQRQVLIPETKPFECIDDDKDGVCDQWDKCLDTPEGIRVDGSGCSLDSDGDGVPDSIDKCPLVAGSPLNGGCPEKVLQISGDEVAETLTKNLEGVEFDYDSDKIREVSYPKLNNAVEVLLANPNYRFFVEGHTDAAGGVDYNQKLSERRAASVVRYLVNKGVKSENLVPIGKGKSDLKWPECNPVTNCPAWKNLENRRVVFKEIK